MQKVGLHKGTVQANIQHVGPARPCKQIQSCTIYVYGEKSVTESSRQRHWFPSAEAVKTFVEQRVQEMDTDEQQQRSPSCDRGVIVEVDGTLQITMLNQHQRFILRAINIVCVDGKAEHAGGSSSQSLSSNFPMVITWNTKLHVHSYSYCDDLPVDELAQFPPLRPCVGPPDLDVDTYQACVLMRMDSPEEKLPLIDRGILDAKLPPDNHWLSPIRKLLEPYCETVPLEGVHRGIISAGPPGTAKTPLMKEFSNHCIGGRHRDQTQFNTDFGVYIVFMGEGASFNKNLVGDGEEALRECARAALNNRHRLCVMLVDEAEVLLADRRKTTEAYKSDRVTVVMSYFGGLKNVDNLLMWSATNLISEIDPACTKRFLFKFHGRLGHEDRFREFIHRGEIDLEAESFPLCDARRYFLTENEMFTFQFARYECTINFTPLQFSRFASFFSDRKVEVPIDRVPAEYLRRMEAKEEGLEFNRKLFELPMTCEAHRAMFQQATQLPRAKLFTGHLKESPHGLQYFIKSGTNGISVLADRVAGVWFWYCRHHEIDHVTLLDHLSIREVTSSSGSGRALAGGDESAIKAVIQERLAEYVNYQRCCIILDVDELCGVSSEWTHSSVSVHNQLQDQNQVEQARRSFANLASHRDYEAGFLRDMGSNFGSILTGRGESSHRAGMRHQARMEQVRVDASIAQQLAVGQQQESESSTLRVLRPSVLDYIVFQVIQDSVWQEAQDRVVRCIVLLTKHEQLGNAICAACRYHSF